MSTLENELVSPINAWHLSAGAKMADFGGWQMPIEYPSINEANLFTDEVKLPILGGVIAEHEAVRTRAGLFDVSHLGKISVCSEKGSSLTAREFINSLFTNDLSKVNHGAAQYTLACNEKGGVVDDLIVYLIDDDNLFLIPNASNTTEVFSIIENALTTRGISSISAVNQHRDYFVFALQGPITHEVLTKIDSHSAHSQLFAEVFGNDWLTKISHLSYMSFHANNASANGTSYVCRTGYTGEFGYEFVAPINMAEKIWRVLATAVVGVDGRIAGLGARDTLRTEMGYPLHGHEITPEISPLQGGATWAVSFEKPAFIARDVLIAQKENGPGVRVRGIILQERGIPRAGMDVFSTAGEKIGLTTSGTFSPTRKEGIALALVSTSIKVGDEVAVDVRGRKLDGKITSLPLVESHVN
jgi:aminomethyltransferase